MSAPASTLTAALAWADLAVFAEVQRVRARGRALGKESPWGAYIGEAEVDEILGDALGIGPFRLPEDVGGGLRDLLAQRRGDLDRSLALDAARERRGEAPSWLFGLVRAFDLVPDDLDILLLALAPELNPRYLRLFAYLHDDLAATWLTGGLALRLLADRREDRRRLMERLAPDAPLLRWGLLTLHRDGRAEQPALARPLSLAPRVARWILHGESQDPSLGPWVERRCPEAPPPALRERAAVVANAAMQGELAWIRVEGRGRRELLAAADALALALARPLLTVDLGAAALLGVDVASFLPALVRELRLLSAVPFVLGPDDDGDGLLALFAHLGPLTTPLIFDASLSHRAAGGGRRVLPLTLPEPRIAERATLWAEALRAVGANPEDAARLSRRYRFGAGAIDRATALAQERALARGAASPTSRDIDDAAAHAISVDPGPLAEEVTLRRSWEDLVLPADASALLHELLAQAERREQVVERLGPRVRPGERGIKALFAGPPGTGKSLAAEVLAHALGHTLLRVDLSAVVSKWVGETEKHLARLFAAAEDAPCVLLFDEADALFGRRTDVRAAQDRYANLEVSYLLQRLESFDGVAILTTNLKRNLDEAFLRRFTFVVDFPFPEAAEREALWRLVLPPALPLAPDIDLRAVAEEFALSGAHIWNVAVAAACAAAGRPDGLIHRAVLAHAIRREYEKLGRDTTALRPAMLLGGEGAEAPGRTGGSPPRALSAAEARRRHIERKGPGS